MSFPTASDLPICSEGRRVYRLIYAGAMELTRAKYYIDLLIISLSGLYLCRLFV